MLKNVLIATVLGVLSGLGTGGGSLLILYLTLATGMAQSEARAINLLFFIPSALIACLFRWKQGQLKIRNVLPGILAGCLSASLLAIWSESWNSELLRKLFGCLLLFTGIRELRYTPKN